jgi:hypothetical protein
LKPIISTWTKVEEREIREVRQSTVIYLSGESEDAFFGNSHSHISFYCARTNRANDCQRVPIGPANSFGSSMDRRWQIGSQELGWGRKPARMQQTRHSSRRVWANEGSESKLNVNGEKFRAVKVLWISNNFIIGIKE